MADPNKFKYIIVGGGLAGAYAVEGIRSVDRDGSIALFCLEDRLPYHRPPLTKDLWVGKKRLEDIPAFPPDYYEKQKVKVFLNREVVGLQAADKTVRDNSDNLYHYEKCLLAMGGSPRPLPNDHGLIHYYRNVSDYLLLKDAVANLRDFMVIGGGFIGAELAAALRMNNRQVTMLFPEKELFQRVFPSDLASFVTQYFRRKGVTVLEEDFSTYIEAEEGKVRVGTHQGKNLTADWVVAGVGIDLPMALSRQAGLKEDNGVIVNEWLQTSDPGIYCAGDLARFPSPSLGKSMRVEHWDNARAQGRAAGVNMAGAGAPYNYLPFFYSDLFDLGFEALGDLRSNMDIYEDWQEPFKKGVVYYLDRGLVKGVLLWNVWKMRDAARALIDRKNVYQRPEDLKGRLELVAAGK